MGNEMCKCENGDKYEVLGTNLDKCGQIRTFGKCCSLTSTPHYAVDQGYFVVKYNINI